MVSREGLVQLSDRCFYLIPVATFFFILNHFIQTRVVLLTPIVGDLRSDGTARDTPRPAQPGLSRGGVSGREACFREGAGARPQKGPARGGAWGPGGGPCKRTCWSRVGEASHVAGCIQSRGWV